MKCEMCGSEGRVLYNTDIEGGRMDVCRSCSAYGKVISKVRKSEKKKKKRKRAPEPEPEVIEMVVEDYPDRLKKAREEKGLKQDEMAQRLGEKASVIRHLEQGDMKPSMDLARRLGKFLGINLIQKYEEKKVELEKKESRAMTIGDMISVD